MTAQLRFGYNDGIPQGTETAWGARLIVTQQGNVDFVYDRQDAVGDDRQRLLEYLRDSVGDKSWDKIKELLASYEMRTRAAKEFTVYQDDTVTMKANTLASAGYCYVVAYFNGVR